jgi:predicted RNA-binding protein YlqC (UPF0109 family)
MIWGRLLESRAKIAKAIRTLTKASAAKKGKGCQWEYLRGIVYVCGEG